MPRVEPGAVPAGRGVDDGVGPVWVVVVAGGSGTRFGRPKQFEVLAGQRVIDRAVDTASQVADGVVVVVPAEHLGAERDLLGGLPEVAAVVAGGATRSESVRCGLAAVPDDAEIICVHDAARPLASEGLFGAVVAAVLAGADGAIPGVPLADTIKVVDAEGWVRDTPDRATLVAVQTPQAFRADVLRAAHETGAEGTDDAALVEAAGRRVLVVEGEADNRKITLAEDLDWASALLEGRA